MYNSADSCILCRPSADMLGRHVRLLLRTSRFDRSKRQFGEQATCVNSWLIDVLTQYGRSLPVSLCDQDQKLLSALHL